MMINEAHAQATAASGRGDGQYPSGLHDGAEISTAAGGQTKAEVPLTMEAVITRENLMLAYQRVVENKGGPCCFTKRLGRQAELGSLRT